MQFILEHQAQFSVEMDKAKERMARLEEAQYGFLQGQQAMQETIRQTQEHTTRQIEHLGNALIELTESHTRTQESLRELKESQAQTQESLRELAESQRHSDRRLDALIDIVRGDRDAEQ